MASHQCILAKVIDAGFLEDGALVMYRVSCHAAVVPLECCFGVGGGVHRVHMYMSCGLDAAQPKGGELKAFGRVRRDGVEVAGHSKLMTFGAFELHAKSALRRATGNMYTMKGRILQASTSAVVPPVCRRFAVTLLAWSCM